MHRVRGGESMNTWNAGQLASVILTLGKMDVDYLGADDTSRKQSIYQFLNMALWKLARLAYNVEYSDPLPVTQDGFVTFKRGSITVTDMFEPLQLLDATNTEVPKRYSYTAPIGWWVDSPNQQIHLKGLTAGSYVLKYLRLPRTVTKDDDPIDMPESGYQTLVHEVLASIKTTKNYYEEAAAMDGRAKAGYPAITQAAISARGPSSGGQPPSYEDVTKARGG